MERPYLSIVLTGRNDNYGGDFKSRLQNCIVSLYHQLSENNIHAEILFVNYNPVEDGVPIEQFIQWPRSTDKLRIRLITVPNHVHLELLKAGDRKNVPVMEYLGKNAGIRRAKGEYILCVNPDIIFPDNLIPELKSLKKDSFYRTDRVDFVGNLASDSQITRVFLKGQDYPINSLDELPELRRKNTRINRWRSFTPKIEWLLNVISVPVYYNTAEYRVHCNVSGDFMLMHRDYWERFCGYNENRPIALHVDALMVVQAAALGLDEVVFTQPIFHQEHLRRYDAKTENPLFKEAFDFFVNESVKMLNQQTPAVYNDSSWGSVNFDLPEINL